VIVLSGLGRAVFVHKVGLSLSLQSLFKIIMRFTQKSATLASVLLLATCSLPTLDALVLERDPDVTTLTEQSKFPGFSIEDDYYLDDPNLSAPCKDALTQTIFCDEYISDYGDEPEWRGFIDTTETSYDSVCDASCGASIRSYWDGIVKECAGYKARGVTTITVVAGRLWEAWNETCHYDAESGRNCNGNLTQLWDLLLIVVANELR
jgi:hypothetical protein